jgi:hypothetical protein
MVQRHRKAECGSWQEGVAVDTEKEAIDLYVVAVGNFPARIAA